MSKFPIQEQSVSEVDELKKEGRRLEYERYKERLAKKYGEHMWPEGMRFEDARTMDGTGFVRVSGGGDALLGRRSLTGGSF